MEWHQVCKTATSPVPLALPKHSQAPQATEEVVASAAGQASGGCEGGAWPARCHLRPKPEARTGRGVFMGRSATRNGSRGGFFSFIRYGCLTHPHKCTACRPPRSCKSGWECCTSARPMGSSRSFCFPGANADIQCEETGRTRECVSGRREEEDVFLRPTAAHVALPVLGLTGTRLLAEGSSLRSPASLREGKPPGEGRPSCSRSSSSSSSSSSLRGSVCLLLVLSSVFPIASILAPVIFDDLSMIF